MDITWYGLSCFRIREGGASVLCDPYAKSVSKQFPKVEADIVTISHDRPGHNGTSRVEDKPKVLRGPGEYEIKNVFVTGMPSSHRRNGGEKAERNVAFFFDFQGLTVGHLGDIGETPKKAEFDEQGVSEVDILLIPVGGGDTLDPTRAVEVISMLEPKILIPMHYQQEDLPVKWVQKLEPVDKFLKELGVSEPESKNILKVSKSSLPEETQVVLLNPTQ